MRNRCATGRASCGIKHRYLAATAISAGNVPLRNYRTKVSQYDEFYLAK